MSVSFLRNGEINDKEGNAKMGGSSVASGSSAENLDLLESVAGSLSRVGDDERLRRVPFELFVGEDREASVKAARAWNEDHVECVSRLADGGHGPLVSRRRRASTVCVCLEVVDDSMLSMI